MNLLEHEAKTLLQASHLPIPQGLILTKDTDTRNIKFPVVLKSQVPTGNRGKLGGIVVVENVHNLTSAVERLFFLAIKGHTPNVLLAEEKLNVKNEHYLALLINRETASIRLVAHKQGGVEVESNQEEGFLNLEINVDTLKTCTEQVAAYLHYPQKLIIPLLTNLYEAFVKNDATLLEINPLIFTASGELVCADCKMELDDAAAFRHPEWSFEDTPKNANFVMLNKKGTVATIANGAGLAMATVDAVASRGLTPANFLDIGGGANMESILSAFRQIMTFPGIEAIIINIFAGITRCDEVARAIIEAQQQIDNLPPLFIRLAGTNFEQAVNLLRAENITTFASLEECLEAVRA